MPTNYQFSQQWSEIQKKSFSVLEVPTILQALESQCSSDLGVIYLNNLSLTTNLEEAIFRQAESKDAVDLLLKKASPNFPQLVDLSFHIKKLNLSSTLSIKQLYDIYLAIGAATSLKNYGKSFLEEKFSESELSTYLSTRPALYLFLNLTTLAKLEERLKKCLLSPTAISDNASFELARIRAEIKNVENSIRKKLERVVKNNSAILQENLIAQRNGRSVLLVKEANRSAIKGIVHDISDSGQTIFIEPLESVEAHNRIIALQIAEQREIERILADLSNECYLVEDILTSNQAILAKIDFTLAKAKLALKMKAEPCQLNKSGLVEIKQGRHPLLDSKKVVPISFSLGKNYTTLIITGPNTGGKTLALKLLGVLVFMAQLGLLLPVAAESNINLYDKILVDMGDGQSISNELSTFSSHIKNIIDITNEATYNTLILADEIGSGTDPVEGASLAKAILQKWQSLACHVLCSSHYRELKEYAFLTEGVENAACRFDPVNMQPQYELDIGQMGISYAFLISERLGLSKDILASAKMLLEDQDRRMEELLKVLYLQQNEAREKLKTAELLEKEFLQRKLEQEQKEAELKEKSFNLRQQEREHIRNKFSEKLAILDAQLQELDKIKEQYEQLPLKEILDKKYQHIFKNLSTTKKIRLSLKTDLNELENEITKETLAQLNKSFSCDEDLNKEPELKVGHTYFSTLLKGAVKLENIFNNKKQCRVQVLDTGLLVNVPINTLLLNEPSTLVGVENKQKKSRAELAMHYALKSQVKARSGTQSPRNTDNQHSSLLELKLLGETVDDALLKIDLHLDYLQLNNLKQARLVHGKGTGKLRQAIAAYLKRDKRVKSFALAPFGQGDSGVTIVELK